jgi:hypothetical protein
MQGHDVEVHIAVGLLDNRDGRLDLGQREGVEGVGGILDGSHSGVYVSGLCRSVNRGSSLCLAVDRGQGDGCGVDWIDKIRKG